MKKLLRYFVNTILFIVIWCIPATLFVGWSFSINGTRPSGLIAIGGIVAIIISYRLVKRINKSKLWSRLFDETEVDNKVVEEKKNETKKEIKKYKKSKLSNLANNLTKLGELKERGLLTEEEFNEQKRKIL
tara:strand:+ start:653 stop:1045 length:393 start_codon:yes stop_codon:yes gene_type:complete